MNIKEIQTALGLKADGIRGPLTNAAILRAADAGRLSILPAPAMVVIKPPEPGDGGLPKAGRDKMAGVHPTLEAIVLDAARASAVPFTVIEGLRTAERQRQLVAAGASKTQNSRHLTGHAVDLWPLDPATGRPLPSDAAFPRGSAQARAASDRLWKDLRAIAATVKSTAAARGIAIEWGGDWGWDAPHFQLPRATFDA